ncbi:hypothetical protein PsYK624_098350 [Phanerochaete sordida]|uniref:Uncharacterized protein n=1 Tax=Phanerochaete sordida TaxID=48140 RepID=A0A9P3GHA6_9APHY|nr:hypothetical protein PsYK624_098350 [Phanerochaete sordida]
MDSTSDISDERTSTYVPSQSSGVTLSGKHEGGDPEARQAEVPKKEFPEGGLRGWATVAGAFCVQFCGFGYTSSFGVYQDYYVRVYLPNESASAISWIGSVNAFVVVGCGLFAGQLYDRGYFKLAVYLGSYLLVIGLFMLSLAQPHQFYQPRPDLPHPGRLCGSRCRPALHPLARRRLALLRAAAGARDGDHRRGLCTRLRCAPAHAQQHARAARVCERGPRERGARRGHAPAGAAADAPAPAAARVHPAARPRGQAVCEGRGVCVDGDRAILRDDGLLLPDLLSPARRLGAPPGPRILILQSRHLELRVLHRTARVRPRRAEIRRTADNHRGRRMLRGCRSGHDWRQERGERRARGPFLRIFLWSVYRAHGADAGSACR